MYLQGFRVGAFETLDKGFRLGDHLLLLVEGLLLLLPTLLPQLEVLAVIHLVIVDASHGDLYGAGSDVIHERTVVTDHHHGLPPLDQKVL